MARHTTIHSYRPIYVGYLINAQLAYLKQLYRICKLNRGQHTSGKYDFIS